MFAITAIADQPERAYLAFPPLPEREYAQAWGWIDGLGEYPGEGRRLAAVLQSIRARAAHNVWPRAMVTLGEEPHAHTLWVWQSTGGYMSRRHWVAAVLEAAESGQIAAAAICTTSNDEDASEWHLFELYDGCCAWRDGEIPSAGLRGVLWALHGRTQIDGRYHEAQRHLDAGGDPDEVYFDGDAPVCLEGENHSGAWERGWIVEAQSGPDRTRLSSLPAPLAEWALAAHEAQVRSEAAAAEESA